MNSESGVTIEIYIIKALQGREEFGFVHGPSAILFINNISLTRYMKMQLILNIRFFFPMVFNPGGQEAGVIMPPQSLRTRILRGRECHESAMRVF